MKKMTDTEKRNAASASGQCHDRDVALGEINQLVFDGGWTNPQDVVGRVMQVVEQHKQTVRQLNAVIAELERERDALRQGLNVRLATTLDSADALLRAVDDEMEAAERRGAEREREAILRVVKAAMVRACRRSRETVGTDHEMRWERAAFELGSVEQDIRLRAQGGDSDA